MNFLKREKGILWQVKCQSFLRNQIKSNLLPQPKKRKSVKIDRPTDNGNCYTSKPLNRLQDLGRKYMLHSTNRRCPGLDP